MDLVRSSQACFPACFPYLSDGILHLFFFIIIICTCIIQQNLRPNEGTFKSEKGLVWERASQVHPLLATAAPQLRYLQHSQRAPAALLSEYCVKIAGMSACRFDSALPKVTRCCKERTMCWAGNISTGLSLQLCGLPSRKCRLSTAPPLDSPNAQGVLCFGGGDNLGGKIASSFFGTSQE